MSSRTITGTEGDDTLWDSSGDSVGDRIDGLGGNDTIYGGLGADTLDGGTGNDSLYGNGGDDSMLGGEGNDYLYGNGGNVWIDGGNGGDTVFGGTGNDSLSGGDGNDSLYGGGGNDSISGGAGDDLLNIYQQTGNAALDGGAGNDTLYGGYGNDSLLGGDGDDTVYGGTGNDTLDGGTGRDYLWDDGGDDQYIVRSRDTRIYDTAGKNSGLVLADFYKTNQSVQSWTWGEGVQKLPYWIDALLPGDAPGFRGYLGAAKTLYYTFPISAPAHFNADDLNGFLPFNDVQKAFARTALAAISNVIDITFVEATDSSAANTIVFSNNYQTASSGYASYPSSAPSGNDVHLEYSDTSTGNLNPADGQFSALTLIHELGHSLGLKHPFNGDSVSGSTEGPYLEGTEENAAWSVMSYNSTSAQYHLAYSPFDIAALQYLYGPSTAVKTNDTIVLSASKTNMLWDGGGTDTLDGSALSAALTLYLEPGYWGHVGAKAATISAAGQIVINFGSVIENATGGAGNDAITGNAADNVLSGGLGNDTLFGGAGNDTLTGAAGADTVRYSGAKSLYTITRVSSTSVTVASALEGTDTLNSVETLVFSDATITIGGTVVLAVPSITAPTSTGWLTTAKPTLSGTATAGLKVEVFNFVTSLTSLGTATADANGAWSLTLASALPEGACQLSAVARNDDGDVSASSATVSFTLDSVAPTAPSLVVAKSPLNVVSGNQPVLHGTAEANSVVEVVSGDLSLGSATANSSGVWTLTAGPLGNASFSAVARARDAAGNVSSGSAVTDFIVQSALNLLGTSGKDTLSGTSGNNNIDGGAGLDVMQYSGKKAGFTVLKTAIGFLVTDGSGADGVDMLANVERIQFADAWWALDVSGAAGQAYRLYQAAFNRVPDLQGLGYHISSLEDKGADLRQVAQNFIDSPEFKNTYGSLDTSQFVTLLYNNILHRAPEPGGYAFYVDGLTSGAFTRAQVLTGISESPENQAGLLAVIGNGFEYVPFV